MLCIYYCCISNFSPPLLPLRSCICVQKAAAPLYTPPNTSATFLLFSSLHLYSAADPSAPCQSRLPTCDTIMERSTQELFLNFMIVLITVLLMWLLVKAYQDWAMELKVRRWMRGRREGEIGVERSQYGYCRTLPLIEFGSDTSFTFFSFS